MLIFSDRQMVMLRAALDDGYGERLTEYLQRMHPERCAELGLSVVRALVKRVLADARRWGIEQGRVIARLATLALLVDSDVTTRPEVEALFAFSGIGADLKADLLCDQVADRLSTVGAEPVI